jgi:heavy metal sensor kinase
VLVEPAGPAVRSLRAPDGERLRALDVPTDIIGLPVVVRAVQSEERVHAELRTIAWSMVGGVCLFIAIAVWGGHRIARRALLPMERLVEEAAAITADRLGQPLTIERHDDEVGRLAAAFNETLRRLNVSFEQARRFSADASHELRTPVTTIRTVGQVALQAPDGEDRGRLRDALASVVEEAERLTRLLDTLLLLSRGDAGQVEMHRETVDLDVLVREIAAQCEVLAEERQQSMALDVRPARLQADPGLLRLAIANVMDNAIRYTPPHGRIAIAVTSTGAGAAIAIADSGPGIDPAHHARLFDRFYRVDRDRSRRSGGTGLGLSIAHWAVALHGGRVTVESSPGAGSTFRIELPYST